MAAMTASTWSLAGVRAVTPDAVVDDATVTIVDDRIESIVSRGPTASTAVDGRGLLLAPGLVDSHSDGLEKEIRPRRTAVLPVDYALSSFEGRLRAAGVTTVFHGLAYQHRESLDRTVGIARDIAAGIVERRTDPAVAVDHRVLYRTEARDGTGPASLVEDLQVAADRRQPPPLVSYEDHTPGQGQFRDVNKFAEAVDPALLPPGVSVAEHVAELMAKADAEAVNRDRNLQLLSPLAVEGAIRLLAHDVETPEELAIASQAGAAVAEFPLTAEVAAAAREAGMAVVMGAPNALRGRSHSGNASARELVATGLCDVIASDYLPSALLASALVMASEGCCSLPAAIGLISSGPAEMVGLDDRGRLAEGARADLVLVDDRGRWPAVVRTWRAGDRSGPLISS